MQSCIRDKVEGTFYEVKGKIKEVAGKLADDPNLEADGTDEKIAGQIQKKTGHHGTGCGGRSGHGGHGSCGGGRPGGGTSKATSSSCQRLPDGSHYQETAENRGQSLHNVTDFERISF